MSLAEATLAPLDESGPTGAGPRLRDARLKAGLELRDIASRLRLDPATIEALENEEYAKLHGPTFVRGYLRGYARALNLPVGPILEAYDRRGDQPPALVADIASGAEETRSSDPPMRLATLAIVVVLIALVVAWWRSQDPPVISDTPVRADEQPAVVSSIVPLEPPVVESEPASPPVEQEVSQPLVSAVSPAPDSAPEPLSTDVPQAEPPAPVNTLSEAPPAIEAPLESGAGESPEPPPETIEAPVAMPPQAAETPPAQVASAADADRVVLNFEHESWVEVYDASGKRMYYNLVKPGQTLDLTGAAPIRVLLGYARGVSVQYNGRPFDHKPFMSKGLARFTLGGSSSGALPAGG